MIDYQTLGILIGILVPLQEVIHRGVNKLLHRFGYHSECVLEAINQVDNHNREKTTTRDLENQNQFQEESKHHL